MNIILIDQTYLILAEEVKDELPAGRDPDEVLRVTRLPFLMADGDGYIFAQCVCNFL